VVTKLERGRQHYQARAWLEAFEALSAADAEAPLELDDLWRLSFAASLSGREPAGFEVLERIYRAQLEAQPLVALRAAFWLGFRLIHLEGPSRGQAWLARAERLLQSSSEPCVEAGYLEIPRVRMAFVADRLDEAMTRATRALSLGERFGDADLATFARNLQGRILVRQGSLEAGFKLLDEAMLAVTANEVSPILTGLVYCSAIDVCSGVFELSRVREWTDSLRGWCEAQPQMVAFTGACLVCRAEVMEVNGHWSEALAEARRAVERYQETLGAKASGEALYRLGELHRLRGEQDEAEARYREASQVGRDPQPGLALLRLVQGRADLAVQALKRALLARPVALHRARLLPALVEAQLAAKAVAEARAAVDELGRIAEQYPTEVLGALSSLARGAVELAEGDAQTSLLSLRAAFTALQRLDAPYLSAKARLQLACACQALDDLEGAQLEVTAARAAFDSLGAVADVQAIDQLLAKASAAAAPSSAGLSARELEVLRLVAAGKTNRLIAGELCLSEKTVDRHVSNILAKLDVPSRAAATAFAYENKLI
jgi:DNA-binding CsgD family transcriptional regulator